MILPPTVSGFLKAHPGVALEIIADDSFIDVLAAGLDAGVRYDERLEQDMIAVPIGPRVQRFEAVQGVQLRLSVKLPYVVAARADHLAGQIALVVEIVRDLRSADGRRVAHLFDAGAGNAAKPLRQASRV